MPLKWFRSNLRNTFFVKNQEQPQASFPNKPLKQWKIPERRILHSSWFSFGEIGWGWLFPSSGRDEFPHYKWVKCFHGLFSGSLLVCSPRLRLQRATPNHSLSLWPESISPVSSRFPYPLHSNSSPNSHLWESQSNLAISLPSHWPIFLLTGFLSNPLSLFLPLLNISPTHTHIETESTLPCLVEDEGASSGILYPSFEFPF